MPANRASPTFRWFRITGFVLTLCLLCALPVRSSDPPKAADNSPVGIDENDKPITAQALYNDGCWYVKHGRNLTYAIKRLRKAVSLSPRNADYHLALGCALAGRVNSLCLAELGRLFIGSDTFYYNQFMDKWRGAESDPENSLYHTDAPKQPQTRTYDDSVTYRMGRTELQDVARSLAVESLSEADQALALTHSPRAKADAYFTRGWLRTLLGQSAVMAQIDLTAASRGIAPPEVKLGAVRVIKLAPDPATIRDLEAATEIAPKNADYWRALGDAHVGSSSLPEKLTDDDREKAVAAYKKSLRLHEDVEVWDRLLEIYEHRLKHLPRAKTAASVSPPVPPPTKLPLITPPAIDAPPVDTALAFTLLSDIQLTARKLVQLDSGNAASYYEEAYATFLETPLATEDADATRIADEVTATVESGNSASYYEPHPYLPHVPLLLQAAFDRIEASGAWYSTRASKIMETHTNVSKALHGAIDQSKKQHDNAQVLHRCQDLVKMAFVTCRKPTGNQSLDNLCWFDSVLSGGDVRIGYATMAETATAMDDRRLTKTLHDEGDDAFSEILSLMNALDSAYRSEYHNQ